MVTSVTRVSMIKARFSLGFRLLFDTSITLRRIYFSVNKRRMGLKLIYYGNANFQTIYFD